MFYVIPCSPRDKDRQEGVMSTTASIQIKYQIDRSMKAGGPRSLGRQNNGRRGPQASNRCHTALIKSEGVDWICGVKCRTLPSKRQHYCYCFIAGPHRATTLTSKQPSMHTRISNEIPSESHDHLQKGKPQHILHHSLSSNIICPRPNIPSA